MEIEEQSTRYVDEVDGGEDEVVVEARDVPDLHAMLTIDSAGVQFNDTSPVPIHSCLNIATQITPDDAPDVACTSWISCIKGMIAKRVAVGAGVVLLVVVIILIEKLLGMDLIDEKKLIQDLSAELLPQLAGTARPTTTDKQ